MKMENLKTFAGGKHDKLLLSFISYVCIVFYRLFFKFWSIA